MQCPHCEKDYPDHLLANMMVNGAFTPEICPICALRIMNAVHGIDRKTFKGSQARHMLQLAKKHLRETGQCKNSKKQPSPRF